MIRVKAVNNTGSREVPTIDYPMYFIPVVDGKEYSHAAETEDIALLLGLQIKYTGVNSQFCKHACRMLQIESNWAT